MSRQGCLSGVPQEQTFGHAPKKRATTIPMSFILTQHLKNKIRALGADVAPFQSVAVAYSGGVDSTLLAYLLAHVLHKKVTVVLVRTPFLHRREKERAVKIAKDMGWALEQASVDLLQDRVIRENPRNRCYHCKHRMIQALKRKVPTADAFFDGSHAEDRKADRPGIRALEEAGVLSPFARTGWSKNEIREAARAFGLSNWNKPSQSCLATRFPYGEPLLEEKLRQVEQAEEILWNADCEQVRVRWEKGSIRIQASEKDLTRLQDRSVRSRITNRLNRLGFTSIFFDPRPYDPS